MVEVLRIKTTVEVAVMLNKGSLLKGIQAMGPGLLDDIKTLYTRPALSEDRSEDVLPILAVEVEKVMVR